MKQLNAFFKDTYEVFPAKLEGPRSAKYYNAITSITDDSSCALTHCGQSLHRQKILLPPAGQPTCRIEIANERMSILRSCDGHSQHVCMFCP